jgi:hypothetical protein
MRPGPSGIDMYRFIFILADSNELDDDFLSNEQGIVCFCPLVKHAVLISDTDFRLVEQWL